MLIFSRINNSFNVDHADGLWQDCSNPIANALELPKSFDKPWLLVLIVVP